MSYCELITNYTALIALQVIWGITNIFFANVTAQMYSVFIIMIRITCSTIIMMPIAIYYDDYVPSKRDMAWFLFLGMTGLVIPQTMFMIGVSMVGPIISSISTPILPIFVVALSIVTKLESFSYIKITGIVISVIGTFVMIDSSNLSLKDSHTVGILLLFLCQVFYAIYNISQKFILNNGDHIIPVLSLSAWTYFMANIVTTVIGTGYWMISDNTIANVITDQFELANFILPMIYIVLLHSSLSVFIATYLNKKLQPSIIAASNTIQPIIVIVIVYLLYGQTITANQAISCILIITGLIIVCTQKFIETDT